MMQGGLVAQVFPSGGSVIANNSDPIVIRTEAPITSSPALAKAKTSVTQASPGPWGNLEYFPVFLEAPSHLVDRFPLPSSKTKWILPSSIEPTLQSFLEKCGLDAADAASLAGSRDKVKDGDLLYLFPPNGLIERMTPAARTALYHELRKVPQNEYHVDPVLITSGDVESWFSSSNLRPEIIEIIKHLSYMRAETLAFSDLPILMSHAQSESEGRTILKALTRTRSLIMKMVLDESTNVPEMMKYWTTGLNLRRKDVEPMLHSVIETQGAEKLDIMHLLPAMPRKYLMTYPDMSMGLEGIFPDCHWTSLNFFNYSVEPYLLDSRLATTAVLERFNPVEAPYRFGDILFFLDANTGDAFHSCVYIADDIVFTKNGRNLLSPWIFMKIEDVKKVYLFDGNGRVQGFRNKKAPASEEGSTASLGM